LGGTSGPEERFQNFLKAFSETGELKYRQRLAQMAITGLKSLVVDFEDLMTFDRDLAEKILENPDEYLKYAEKAVWAQMRFESPEYADEKRSFFARFRSLPISTPLRTVGSQDMGKMKMLEGSIVRASTVKPFLMIAMFKCDSDHKIRITQEGTLARSPSECPECRSKGPFEFIEKESVFINSQETRIQERPEDLPPGQLPRIIDVRLTEDLVDVTRPGDRVTITGVIRAVQERLAGRGRLRTFELFLDANLVDVLGKEEEIVRITPEEEKQIRSIAKNERVHSNIMNSIAPSVYGYADLKEAIMYLLFGGVHKVLPDGVTIRGDSNMLIVGDPGTAKSQLLQYVARIAPRGLYTSGRGSTAAGLTAAVIHEKAGGMTLEAGALVLADKGICCIDEIEKMRPEDRVSIHEAMEQQTVSIAKGGIVATLNARTSVLAAANPALGRYNPYQTVTENISLPVTILSRFDLIFVIRDEPDKERDERMAEHILSLHKAGVSPIEPPINPQLLRKYFSYAKSIRPIMTDEARQRIQDFYLRIRSSYESEKSPVAITPRQLESIVRLSEARARAALRKTVTVEDVGAVILLYTRSLEQVGIDLESGKMDIDIIMTGKPKSVRDKLQAVLSTIISIEKDKGMAKTEDIYEALLEIDINREDADRFIRQLKTDGAIFEPKNGFLKRTSS
jgi:replicative DNA helicase Mcm